MVTVSRSAEKQRKAAGAGSGATGIPGAVQAKFEAASGLSFEDVRVHYHAPEPARLGAYAYTRGNQVYIGPGQERHLEHELGHVLQQKLGLVKPDGRIGGLPVNRDPALERAADAGADRPARSLQGSGSEAVQGMWGYSGGVVQMARTRWGDRAWEEGEWEEEEEEEEEEEDWEEPEEEEEESEGTWGEPGHTGGWEEEGTWGESEHTGDWDDEDWKPGAEKPYQIHHFATNKHEYYTAQFEKIVEKYDLDLDGAWNKEELPHQGRHPNSYHQFVLEQMQAIDRVAHGDVNIFLEMFENNVKSVVRAHPDMLYS